MGEENQRIVLLNSIVSRSISRAPQEHTPPTHGLQELLEIIEQRRKAGWTVEFFGVEDDPDDEVRVKKGLGHTCLRLRLLNFKTDGDFRYATMLIEFVDDNAKSFPVVDTQTFDGRELSGKKQERGATAAHIVARMPIKGSLDQAIYRCAIEVAHKINRTMIEVFLNRQIKRHSDQAYFKFVVEKKKKKKTTVKEYKYHPKIELLADMGRKVQHGLTDGRFLSHMVFSKRALKQSIGQPAEIIHDEVLADVEYRISARQGPDDPTEKTKWAIKWKTWYEKLGFESKMYFRSVQSGATLSGEVHQAVSSAADLLMCSKEIISLTGQPKPWRDTIDKEIEDHLKSLVDDDSLWERSA